MARVQDRISSTHILKENFVIRTDKPEKKNVILRYVDLVTELLFEGHSVEIFGFGKMQIVKKKSKYDPNDENYKGKVFDNKYPGYYFTIMLNKESLEEFGYKFKSSKALKSKLHKLLMSQDCSNMFEYHGE